MKRSRLPALWLIPAAALLLGLSGCKPSETAERGGGGFDTTAPRNRPESPRFGMSGDALSPASRDLLEKTRTMTSDARPSSGDGVADFNRWKQYFDGAGDPGSGAGAVSAAGNKPQDGQIERTMLAQGVRQDIVSTVMTESKKQGVDPLLTFAVMKQESSFNPRVTSPAGARGLMQVMPGTGRQMGVAPAKLYEVQSNVHAGVKYLKHVWDTFAKVSMEQLSLVDPFSRSDVKAAIAAYNAGPGNVARYDGVPPFRETQNYVVRVLQNYREFQQSLGA